MNSIDVLFKTNRFNLSKVGEHFINPCCFGEDVVSWFRSKLVERGIQVTRTGQEDWGWYLFAHSGEIRYFVGVGGNSDESSPDPDQGEWRLVIERRRTLWERLLGKGQIASDDKLIAITEEILRSDPSVREIRRE